MSTIFYGICHFFVHNTRKRSPLEMCQLQAPGQLLLFSLTQCARPSSIRASSASPTPKVDELPEGGIKGIECWGYLINISIYGQYFWLYLRKQIHGAFNRQEQNQTAP